MSNPNSLVKAQYDTLGIEPELYEEGLAHFSAAHDAVERQGVLIEEMESPFSEVSARLQLAREESAAMEELTREPAFVLGVVGAVSARRESASDEAILEEALRIGHGGSK